MNLYNLFEAPKITPAQGTTGVMDNQVQSAVSPIGSGTSRWEQKKKPVTMMGVGNNGVVAEARDVQLDEISNKILGDYKKAAGADATAADKAGDIERGNKRFKGIVKATIKQGENDAKKHKEQGVAEGDNMATFEQDRELADVPQDTAPEVKEGLAQDEAEEEYGGWRAELVNQINYNTFEVEVTNARSKESANFIIRPVDMVSYGPTLSVETFDVHDLQTGQTQSWTNDDPAPEGPIAYAISALFYDEKPLQKALWNIVDTHNKKGQDKLPGLDQRRSIGQEVGIDDYVDAGEKTQAAMAKMKKGMAEGDMYGDKEVSWEKGGRRAPTGAFRNPAANNVVFSGTGDNGGKYEIIQSGDDFMIHANGKHIDSYSSLQRAMSVLQNEVPGLTKGVAEAQTDYQKRRQRERDVDAGKPVKPEPKNPQNDYFARRKKEKEQGVAESMGRATPKMPKARDPGHAVLAAKRGSGAAGQHTNKRRQAVLQPKHQKPLTRDMDLGEGLGKNLAGAALAGAMALGGGAQAQSAGDQYQPNMVAHITYSVNGQNVTKDINLGSQYGSARAASDAVTNMLKSKGIKYFSLDIKRVGDDQVQKDYMATTPASDASGPGSIDTRPYRATAPSSKDDYMVREELDESIERRLMQMRHAGYDI